MELILLIIYGISAMGCLAYFWKDVKETYESDLRGREKFENYSPNLRIGDILFIIGVSLLPLFNFIVLVFTILPEIISPMWERFLNWLDVKVISLLGKGFSKPIIDILSPPKEKEKK